MGIDFLEVAIELEEQFGVRIEPDDLAKVWATGKNDCTAGQLHELVCRKCQSCGIPVPRSSWNRVKFALSSALGISPARITTGARLRGDLEFY